MAKDEQYNSLMEYLKLLHKEKAIVTDWLPEYGENGEIKLMVNIKSKIIEK